VSGRQAGVFGIQEIIGPTIATVPICVKLDWDQTIWQLLETTQRQAADMISFEQTGLQNIRHVSEEAALACQFQTLLVVEPVQTPGAEQRLFVQSQKSVEETPTTITNFSTYALSIVCQLEDQGMDLQVHFDSATLAPTQVSRMMKQFEHILRQLMVEANHLTCIRGLSFLDDCDLQKIWKWNAAVPAPVETRIYDFISENARNQPLAPAICAWDGELTYAQLDSLSTQLTDRLVSSGVRQEVLVPLCFEKSMWMAVAMLGVMKSSGAFVPLDVS
jgi:non-ribosomal peptide synthetase component F